MVSPSLVTWLAMITPMKNSLRPTLPAASEIEPTRISDITPTATPASARAAIGLSPFFVSVIVVAIVGNAAEHWVAVFFAMKDKMDLSVNIAIGSSAQIALFVAPVLVLCSLFIGPSTMALVFNGFELGAVVFAVLIAQQVVAEGESTWFEGAQLLAVYVVLGCTFFFVG